MSVPSYKRSENKLQALKDTLAMTSYTIHMCENEKIFPKKTRWNLCSRIIDNCLNAVVHIRQANKINPQNEEMYRERIAKQYLVILDFEALWGLMTVAFEAYNIPSEKVSIWSNLMLTADERVAAWRNSDIKKFKEKYGKSYKD